MKRLDYLTAAIMLGLAVIIVLATAGLDFWDDDGPSTRFMPVWVSGVSAVLAILLILEARRREIDPVVDWPNRLGIIRVVLTSLAIIVFIALVPFLGFLPATAAFVLFMTLGVERRPALPSILTTVVTSVVIQAVFVWWLHIALPKGVLGI